MASANMKDIKRRIKSVESTKQITKAMELVASSKLRKAKEKADKARDFFNTLYETMCEIYADNSDFSSEFTRNRTVKTVLLVVIAGDRGLAGGFNGNILKMATARAVEIEQTGAKVKILSIGKKSAEFFAKRGFDVLESYIGIGETIGIYEAKVVSTLVVERFLKKEFDRVELFYTTLVSALSQEAKALSVLPVEMQKNSSGAARVLTEYDPSAEAVFDAIVPQYIAGLVFGSIADSFAAEQASRRIAMESASDNADEMIQNLSLVYNRARQASITQEITEIIGGAQAQG